mmetsp:Transcript_17125/g.44511  ORF Transcript_17125/g.44511 Transcript_17125/m.44511 type:complete len:240 (+) Transcript_17125:154-873(+)
MQIIRWTGGGFGMAAHNYDGDMLTDEVAQVHRSPGFITSNLIGKRDDGTMIKEFEASHGTVADLWEAHLRGEETSMNPLGMVEAVIGALDHSAALEEQAGGPSADAMKKYTTTLRKAMHNTFRYGQGTRDMSGPEGLTTEQFVDKVADRLSRYLEGGDEVINNVVKPDPRFRRNFDVDEEAVKVMFSEYDTDQSGSISFDEFLVMTHKLGIAPKSIEKANEFKKDDERDSDAAATSGSA